jgi:hypothetical protein
MECRKSSLRGYEVTHETTTRHRRHRQRRYHRVVERRQGCDGQVVRWRSQDAAHDRRGYEAMKFALTSVTILALPCNAQTMEENGR